MLKPAYDGGKPVRKNFLVFGKPQIQQEEIDEVVSTLKSGWLGTGPKTKLFEENFRKYIGCKFAIALNSCTAGLHLALDVLGVSEGDEVITTPLTFASTANVIVHHHAKPVFVDVDPHTWNIDPKQIEKKVTKKTKVIIPVDLHGRPCEYSQILQIAKKHKLYILEDAAHAAEAVYFGKKIGSLADFTAFSFYVTKNIMTGEGGMLTTNKPEWAEEARIRSLHGISKDAWKRYSSEGFKPYETLYPGYKYNMMDLVASLGIHQLARVKKNLALRNRYWHLYDEAFKNSKILTCPAPETPRTTHARHLYAILVNTKLLKINRDQFIDALKEEGIGTGIHFTPVHLHSFYRRTYGYRSGELPNSELVGSSTISLPLSPAMTEKDIQDVIQAVTKILAYYKK